MAVKPGPKGEIDHTHGDGQPHDHGDGQTHLHGGYFPARVAAADIMNLAAANYEAQIGVEFKLEYHVAKGPMTYIGHQYANTGAYALLQEFRTRWESGWLAPKRRGAVHLLTGKNIDG